MPRFSANLSTMFREYSHLDRPRAAFEAGFRCVEMQFPYDLDLNDLTASLQEYSLSVSVLNVPSGDFIKGGEGNAAIPERTHGFRESVAQAKRFAQRINPLNVNILAGEPARTRHGETCRRTLADNLHHAAGEFADIGVRVVVEAINNIDRPDFMLNTAESVIDILDRANHPNLALQFDVYHMAMMGIPVVEAFEAHSTRIGHIQFADAPGRHEPGTGSVEIGPIFDAIDRSGYDGWVAAEYFPANGTEDSLSWMQDYS